MSATGNGYEPTEVELLQQRMLSLQTENNDLVRDLEQVEFEFGLAKQQIRDYRRQRRNEREREARDGFDFGQGAFDLRGLDLSQLRPVAFAWHPWMVKGAYNEIVGEEGVGKSTLQAYIAAGITNGTLPGDLEGRAMDVLFIGADEDDWHEAVGPRLHVAGADLDRVVELHSHGGQPFNIVDHAAELEGLLGKREFGLVIIEQVLDVLPSLRNPNDPMAIRRATKPFRSILRRVSVTSLAARHVNKAEAQSYRQAGQGSVQFGALARAGFLVAEHRDDQARRVMVMGKANYSEKPSMSFELAVMEFALNGYAFDVSQAINFKDEQIDMADVLSGKARRQGLPDERIDAVADALTDEPSSVREVAKRAGVSKSATARILDDLYVAGRAANEGSGWTVPPVPPLKELGQVGHPPQNAIFDYEED